MNDTIKSRQVGVEVWVDVLGTIVAVTPETALRIASDLKFHGAAAAQCRDTLAPPAPKTVNFIESKA